MSHIVARAGFDAGWSAALEEAARIAEADLHYTTMELTGGRGTKSVRHYRVAHGSKEHADAIRALITTDRQGSGA